MRGLLLCGLCGCSSILGLKGPKPLVDGAAGDDAPAGDANGDLRDAPMCLGNATYTVCFDTFPTGATSLSGAFSTDGMGCDANVHWTDPDQTAACFVTGTNVTVGAFAATGTRPLVIVATDTITFSGLVDLSSHVGVMLRGAGAVSTGCSAGSAAAQSTEGGGGGAGGSYATAGAGGGSGQGGAAGATPGEAATIDALRGGCPGTPGAKGGGAIPGPPGGGGGALYAVAGTAITLSSAQIAANGGGGAQPQNRFGGAGGGAGGMIVLFAPLISGTASVLVANGGGGASGADGSHGEDPDPTTPTVAAAGGAGASGGDGGAGYTRTTAAVAGSAPPTLGSTGGGGGGGGGGGYIRTNVLPTGVTASPAIDVVP